MKEAILEKVKELVEKRMNTSWEAMEAAKNSANEESKSSAGDKYETARAMGQLDREMNGRMYEQARQERQLLDKINPGVTHTAVNSGALTETSMGTFYVAVGTGAINVDGKNIMVISPQSPIGQAIMRKKTGETFTFRGKTEQIISIN
ncbi:GreA/GreB family elongation factor [Emticicia sp. TH156]|uniref:GreA/GreB family elongation factor n=1 Tax=Emticicia sp. TH156 TaxID=2067454 RepID=UPI000C7806C1|nr:GreA/GreB family elongation factor [Emticicia sp. TH156]PLK43236.1 transcription elongation factor [Emticicia sp. TH156]